MRAKFRILNAALWLLISSSSALASLGELSGFEHPALGQCFDSSDAFVRSALGEAAVGDSNITQSSKDAWTWVIDQTASKNYTWYLFRKEAQKVCFRAFVPTASDVRMKSANHGLRFEAHISPEAGLPGKLIELNLKSSEKFAAPTRCFLLLSNTPAQSPQKRKAVSCMDILD